MSDLYIGTLTHQRYQKSSQRPRVSTEGLLTAESSYASYQPENIKIWVYILDVFSGSPVFSSNS